MPRPPRSTPSSRSWPGDPSPAAFSPERRRCRSSCWASFADSTARNATVAAEVTGSTAQLGSTTAAQAGVATNAGTAANAALTVGNSASAATSAASSAGSLASSLSPVLDIANHAAVAGHSGLPLLSKAAVGVGAVTVAFTAAPERPIETPPAIEVEAASPAPAPPPDPVPAFEAVVIVPATPSSPPVVTVQEPAATATPTSARATTSVAVLPDEVDAVRADSAPPAQATPPVVAATASTVVAATAPAPTTTASATTTMPTTTTSTTTPPPPPIVGGTATGTPVVAPSGPRLDITGGVNMSVAGVTTSGTVNGRVGIGEPDATGSRRLDGTLTLALSAGTIDVRLVGYATTSQEVMAGTVPTSINASGLYRASGATGQLATAGSFTIALSNGALTLTLAP